MIDSDLHNVHVLAECRHQIEHWKTSMEHEPFHLDPVTETLRVLSGIADEQSSHAHVVGGIQQVVSNWKGVASIAALQHVSGVQERCAGISSAIRDALGALHGTHQTVASCEAEKQQLIAQAMSRLDTTSPIDDAEVSSTQLFIEQVLSQLESLRSRQHAEIESLGQELEGLATRADDLPSARIGSVVNPRAAYEHLIREFHLKGLSFRDTRGSDNRAAVWSLSQEIAALISLAAVPGENGYAVGKLRKVLRMLAPYWDAKRGAYLPYPVAHSTKHSLAFYDDNAWVGIDLVNIYSLTGERKFLVRAKQIMKFERTGWDMQGGGMFWNDTRTKVSAAATAGAAQLALELAKHTGSQADLAWGIHTYSWTQHNMSAHNSPLIVDGKDHHIWSYNQGLMVGNAALLYQITGKEEYLHQGVRLADAAIHHFGDFASQPAKFNAIFFKNLQHLNSVLPTPNGRFSDALMGYAGRCQGMHSVSLIQRSGFVQAQAYASTSLHPIAGK